MNELALDDLSDPALDELPFGVVCLDPAMTVLRFNRTEQERSGIQRWRAVGRDFFGEIAPGPTNQTLAEHVASFASARSHQHRISHTFQRRTGADTTTIDLVRGRDRVYLCIRRD